MTQHPLTRFFNSSQKSKARAGDSPLELLGRPKFVDLFCGAGGASCGADQAGYEIVLAVDNWQVAIECHFKNHPNAVHICTELPPSDPLPLPTTGVWHLHGSPPCTKVSCANIPRRQDEREEAVDLIRWYIIYAIRSGATSWSMEQVSTPIVIKILETLRAPGSPYRNKFEYGTFEFSDYGVPQQRKRLLAGSPGLIARFRRLERWHRTVKDVILQPRGTHVRNNVCLGYRIDNPMNPSVKRYKRYTIEDSTRPISMAGYTVVSGNFLHWATFQEGPEGEEYRNSYDYTSLDAFNVEESAKLQCFPDSYAFPEGRQNGLRLVGNAIPPIIMRQLLPCFTSPHSHQTNSSEL